MITHIEHLLQFAPDDSPTTKLAKLEAGLQPYSLPLAEVVSLLAGLLSVPLPAERYAPLTVTPQQQKQQTLDTLVAWLVAEAERQPVLVAWEDLHWADPTTLEVLDLLVERTRNIPLLLVLTHRPEFQNRWANHSHVSALNLSKLTKAQSSTIVSRIAKDKALPGNLLEQIVGKTDGVPLFVEELTQAMLESRQIEEKEDRYEYMGDMSSITIPVTLLAAEKEPIFNGRDSCATNWRSRTATSRSCGRRSTSTSRTGGSGGAREPRSSSSSSDLPSGTAHASACSKASNSSMLPSGLVISYTPSLNRNSRAGETRVHSSRS
jgi:hypothetical protein